MYRKSDNDYTRSVKNAKREVVNSQQFLRISPIFINHFSGSIGNTPYMASGINKFGNLSSKVTRTGTTQVPLGFYPTNFGVLDDESATDFKFGMTAMVFGIAGTPIGYGTVVTRSMFVGFGGVSFTDDRSLNAIKVSSNPVFSPNYWMSI